MPNVTDINSAIETRGLTRHFGPVKAVAGVDLDVRKGEMFGFLGPNGAGKTTVIRMLITLLAPTSGEIMVAGYDVMRHSPGGAAPDWRGLTGGRLGRQADRPGIAAPPRSTLRPVPDTG